MSALLSCVSLTPRVSIGLVFLLLIANNFMFVFLFARHRVKWRTQLDSVRMKDSLFYRSFSFFLNAQVSQSSIREIEYCRKRILYSDGPVINDSTPVTPVPRGMGLVSGVSGPTFSSYRGQNLNRRAGENILRFVA
jgi:hypothetical protein